MNFRKVFLTICSPALVCFTTGVVKASTSTFEIVKVSPGKNYSEFNGYDSNGRLRLNYYVSARVGLSFGLYVVSESGLSSEIKMGMDCQLEEPTPPESPTIYDYNAIESFLKTVDICPFQVEYDAGQSSIRSITQLCQKGFNRTVQGQRYVFSALKGASCPGPKEAAITFVRGFTPLHTSPTDDLEAPVTFNIKAARCTSKTVREGCIGFDFSDLKDRIRWQINRTDSHYENGDRPYGQYYATNGAGLPKVRIREGEFKKIISLINRECRLQLTVDPTRGVLKQVAYTDCSAE